MKWRMSTFQWARAGVLAAGFAILPNSQSLAQADYPNRTIKFVVPLPAGGGPDMLARTLADKLSTKWGQSVVVENRPGASGNLAAQSVANAKPDGYTLLVGPIDILAINKHLFATLGYDPEAFAPVSVTVKTSMVLATRAGLPVSTLAEFMAYAKANPGKVNIATTGPSSIIQIMATRLMARAKVQPVYVPYPGIVNALPDLLGDRIDAVFFDLGNLRSYITAGKLKALGVGGDVRIPELPDVPAISETFPGFQYVSSNGVVAPPNTPPEITAKLSQAIAEALRSPDVVKRLDGYAMTPAGSSPVETGAFLKQTSESWREIIAAAGIKPE